MTILKKMPLQDINLLMDYAKTDSSIWNKLIGCGIAHYKLGNGTINKIKSEKHGTYIFVDFSSRKDVQFNINAIDKGILKDLRISNKLYLGMLQHHRKRTDKKDRDLKAKLKEYKIESLWYITHIDSLLSIIENGILCRNYIKEKQIECKDISNENVQTRRTSIHNQVNLYFANNTSMLYVVIQKFGESIILLEIDALPIMKNQPQFADGNAASNNTAIYDDLKDLDRLNWEIIYNREPEYYGDNKRIRAAEVLVEKQVPPSCIKTIHVQCTKSKQLTQNIQKMSGRSDIPIKIDLTARGVFSHQR